jgi:hypothetical protein
MRIAAVVALLSSFWLVVDGPAAAKSIDAATPVHLSIYEEVGSNIIEVFDLDRQYLYVEGREFLATMRHTEGFGGAIRPCQNSRFHCLQTSMYIAVPKGDISVSWRYRAMRCQVLSVAGKGIAKTYSVRCTVSPTRSVEFEYSRAGGVLSYVRKCPECDGRGYRLVRGRGLFASGS